MMQPLLKSYEVECIHLKAFEIWCKFTNTNLLILAIKINNDRVIHTNRGNCCIQQWNGAKTFGWFNHIQKLSRSRIYLQMVKREREIAREKNKYRVSKSSYGKILLHSSSLLKSFAYLLCKFRRISSIIPSMRELIRQHSDEFQLVRGLWRIVLRVFRLIQ